MGSYCEYFAIWPCFGVFMLFMLFAVVYLLLCSWLILVLLSFPLSSLPLVFLALLFWLFRRLVLTIVRMGRIGWDGTEQDYD